MGGGLRHGLDAQASVTHGSGAYFAGSQVVNVPPAQSDRVDIYEDAIGSNYCAPAVANSTGQPALIAAQGCPGSAAQGSVVLNVRRQTLFLGLPPPLRSEESV
jgi:hypothetical protein